MLFNKVCTILFEEERKATYLLFLSLISAAVHVIEVHPYRRMRNDRSTFGEKKTKV